MSGGKKKKQSPVSGGADLFDINHLLLPTRTVYSKKNQFGISAKSELSLPETEAVSMDLSVYIVLYILFYFYSSF